MTNRANPGLNTNPFARALFAIARRPVTPSYLHDDGDTAIAHANKSGETPACRKSPELCAL